MNKSPKMHKCGRCNKTATWLYLPSSSGINFFCDDCVPRGCTCNVMGLDIEEPDEQLSNRSFRSQLYDKKYNILSESD